MPIPLSAQAENRPPRLFPAFAGTWTLDQSGGSGHIAGLPVARSLVIATSPTGVSVIKDLQPAEEYRWDGKTPARSDGQGVLHSGIVLVAETLALTTTHTREARGHAFTNIITDAYRVSGDVLTIERQLSVLVEPPGSLATLEEPANNRQTLVYRRAPASASN
jgi:hypothetical protein